MKPPTLQSAMPAPTVASRAAAMSDAMLCTLLAGFQLDPSNLRLVRTTFVSYCEAHPQLKDMRTAWAAFHQQLIAHMAGNTDTAAVLAVAFAQPEPQQPVAITTSPHIPAPWPDFLHRYWTPKPPTAFTDERLKLARTDRRSVINLIATAQRMGVPEEFIIDRSKYTATDIALRDIRHAILQPATPSPKPL